MIFDTLEYVDGLGATQEVALQLADPVNAGVVPANNRVRFNPATHAAGSFTISWAQSPETEIAIPFKSRCKVRIGRTSTAGAVNTFSGGTIIFQGRRWDNEGSASATRVQTTLTLLDAWKELEKITLQFVWKYPSGGTTSSPTYSTFSWPDVVLFQAVPGVSYPTTVIAGTINTWQQIMDVLNYAIGYAGGADAVELQFSTTPEFTPTYLNWRPERSIKCANALLICLAAHPGVFTEIDYSTSPPTIHFRNRATLTAVDLPYKSTLGDGTIHVATDIKALNELVPDAVRLYYKINSTFNDQPSIAPSSDIYPPGAPNSLLCLDYSIDITGASYSQTYYDFVSHAFDPTSKDLWRLKTNSLKQISEGGQIPNDGGSGALALLDATINGGGGHPDGLQVVDEAGSTISLGTYLYYTDMAVYPWMTLSGGSAASVKSANVVGVFSYNKNTGGALNLTPKVGRQHHSMRLKLTNAPSGRYIKPLQLVAGGESIPANLAQSIYDELQDLQWKVRHEIFQAAATTTAVPTLIKPGLHKINLTGGLSAWETMNAAPENVSIELFRVRAGGDWYLAAQTTINCGPANHLEPGYLVQLANLFWNRDRSRIDTYQRLTGSISSTVVDLTAEAARENSVPANADFQTHVIYAPDAADATRSIAITHDATTGQGQVAQLKTSDGSNYTTGILGPTYSGAGAPSSSTLATNAFYRVKDRYFDTSNSTEYICTTAGDKSSSVWAQISGGSGSALQDFRIVSDGGDYWRCLPYIGGSLGTVEVNICKPYELRAGSHGIASQVIAGITYTYTYTAVTVSGVTYYYKRNVSGSDGSSYVDYPVPTPLGNETTPATSSNMVLTATQMAADISIPTTIATAAIHAGGTGYAVNNVLTVAGGTGTAATIKVLAVSSGVITSIQLLTFGNYTANPSLSANAATGGAGSGATFDLTIAPIWVDINRAGRAYTYSPYN